MKKMTTKEIEQIKYEIMEIMRGAVSSEYVRYILEHEDEKTGSSFMEDVINDVICTSAWEDEGYYNDDDIRLAIGRIFTNRLGIEI